MAAAGAAGLKPAGARRPSSPEKPYVAALEPPPSMVKTPSKNRPAPPPPPSHKKTAAAKPSAPVAVVPLKPAVSDEGWEVIERDDATTKSSAAAVTDGPSLLDDPVTPAVSEWNPFKPGGMTGNRRSVVDPEIFADAFGSGGKVLIRDGDGGGGKDMNRMSVASDIFSDARAFGGDGSAISQPPFAIPSDPASFFQSAASAAPAPAPIVELTPEPLLLPAPEPTPVILYQ
ncbi:hypothetical protein HDU67_005603, partial [Dinochytrium kinnereticum]